MAEEAGSTEGGATEEWLVVVPYDVTSCRVANCLFYTYCRIIYISHSNISMVISI